MYMGMRNEALQRRSDATALITEGSIWRAVWYFAWPSAINNISGAAYGFINAAFLGHLARQSEATNSLAAAGIAGNSIHLQFAFVMGLSAGTAALVSQFTGAGKHEDAEQAARQSLIVAVLAGILTGIPLALLGGPIAALAKAAPDVVPLAASYTAIIAWTSSIPWFIYMLALVILRSQGDAMSPFYTGIVMISLNILFDWLLIFGVGPFPALGINGAAWATSISRIAAMIVSVYFLRRSSLGGALSRWRLDTAWIRRALAIGWPASLQSFIMTAAGFAFIRILGLLPAAEKTAAQAAYTVAMRIEAISFMPGVAFSTAATPLVGQNLGAGKPARAARSAWIATGQAVGIMAFVGSLFLLIPHALAAPFKPDPVVLPMIVSYLIINSFSEPFLAVNMVLRGALQGAGDTLVPMLIILGSLWVVRIPLQWLLAIRMQMGAPGAWWAMSVTACLAGLLMLVWFRFGGWENRRI